MTTEIAIVFTIIIASVILFITEWIAIENVAFLIMLSVILTGLVTPAEGVMGLSNQATVTIIALMILAAALEETGAVNMLGRQLEPVLVKKEWKTIGILMLTAGVVSAVISTTAVVIVFLKIINDLHSKIPTNISKLLMPISFAGILGGSCSMIGTSTNLLVNSVAVQYGYPSFGIFEFTKIGVIILVVAILYMLLIGRHLIPPRRDMQSFWRGYDVTSYLSAFVVAEDSPLVGKPLSETVFGKKDQLDIVKLERYNESPRVPGQEECLMANDIIMVKSSVKDLQEISAIEGLSHLAEEGESAQKLTDGDVILVEVVVQSNSSLIGKTLNNNILRTYYGAVPLAIRKKGKFVQKDLKTTKIYPGNILLLSVQKASFPKLYKSPSFITLKQVEDRESSKNKQLLSIGIIGLVVILSALNILPIMVSALLGVALMFLAKCIEAKQAFISVNWSIIFLLAGMIPLGTAMKNTGADQFLVDQFLAMLPGSSVWVYLICFYFLTTALSSIVSNNATALLVAPIAITLAIQLELPVTPFLLVVMFAANYSFLTPIGYQTNTLIYEPGQYKFQDFFITGGLLTLITGPLVVFLIYYLYF